jgi:hypothetical protein
MSFSKQIIWVSLFAVAMGFLETAVVIYLRELYYPAGFRFPLVRMDSIAGVEVLREAATIIMLLGIAWMNGKNGSSRFAWFLYSFAVWDIVYYAGLKLFLNWPLSINEWDILFLIPLPWAGPVWAPLVISASMISLALIILVNESKGRILRIEREEWILFIVSSLIMIYSFVFDYLRILEKGSEQLLDRISAFIPGKYHWELFVVAFLLIVVTQVRMAIRVKTSLLDENEK